MSAQAMFSLSFDNDDLLPRIVKPVLITHGAKDAVVKLTLSISTRPLWPMSSSGGGQCGTGLSGMMRLRSIR